MFFQWTNGCYYIFFFKTRFCLKFYNQKEFIINNFYHSGLGHNRIYSFDIQVSYYQNSQEIKDHIYQLISIPMLALVIIKPQENTYQLLTWRIMVAIGLKETEYLFVLSCCVPKTIVAIGNIVSQRSHIAGTHGAYNLLMEKALNRYYTKEHKVINFDKIV